MEQKAATLTLEALCEAVREVEKQQFIDQYTGFFLVALGTLSVEEIRQTQRSRIPGLEPDDTLAVSFGDVLKHDAKQHPHRGQVFFLGGDTTTEFLVGRSATCEITVDDPSVSDIQCVLKWVVKASSAELRVTDAGSTNGTMVNLERLPCQVESRLVDEDIVSLGRCSFQAFSAAGLYDQLVQI